MPYALLQIPLTRTPPQYSDGKGAKSYSFNSGRPYWWYVICVRFVQCIWAARPRSFILIRVCFLPQPRKQAFIDSLFQFVREHRLSAFLVLSGVDMSDRTDAQMMWVEPLGPLSGDISSSLIV